MNKKALLTCICLVLLTAYSLAQKKTSPGKSNRHQKTSKIEYGTASFYHDKFNGRSTANGERFDQAKLTAAHNSLPLGTWIEVTNLKNEKSVIVKVNDRMHRDNPRLVDLSSAAATELGIKGDSLIKVKVKILGKKRRQVKRRDDQ
jgi:rare lipoprotein A